MAAFLKTLGYAISTLSVLLLGIVSWDAAVDHPVMMGCLVGGMAASIMGMVVRLASFLAEQRAKSRAVHGPD